MKYYENSKISTPIVELLFLKLPQKKVGDAINFLGWLAALLKNDNEDETFEGVHVVDVPALTIQDALGVNYTQILAVLIDSGLIVRNPHYTVGFDENNKGKCRQYGITNKGFELINAPLKQYLKYICEDPEVKGKVRRSIQKRGLRAKTFDCLAVKYAHSAIIEADFNHEVVASILDRMPRDKHASNISILIQIFEKKYKALEKHEGTGRIYNPLNQLSSEIRKCLVINGRKFARSIDMRACHMTFLADYIQDHCTKLDLSAEVKKYRAILCDEQKHPKHYFAEELDLLPDQVKQMLNTTLNGGREKGTAAWFKWFQREFPGLHGQWDREDGKIKKTGVNISRLYESRIFRADSIIQLAEDCKVTVVDAHDALFIFGDAEDAKVFSDKLKVEARAISGFNLQFGEDDVNTDVYDPKKDFRKLLTKIKKAEKKKQWLRLKELKKDMLLFAEANGLTDQLAA